ncbi:PAS domain-containing protein [Ascidiimonas sp. W6]|uniref:PAS domain-containing protein n=1 Tax=Ascidiimonas meishanensis TaxID=3128903 RepID=UPI0030EE7906
MNALKDEKEYVSPIRSFDFYLDGYQKLIKKVKLKNELNQLQTIIKQEIQPSLKDLLEITTYDALVVTNHEKEILWTNNGFREMTGYSTNFVIGKNPKFLHGSNTSKATLLKMREELKRKNRCTADLINYKKNGKEYWCRIDILPLYDSENEISFYLAMERELRAA